MYVRKQNLGERLLHCASLDVVCRLAVPQPALDYFLYYATQRVRKKTRTVSRPRTGWNPIE